MAAEDRNSLLVESETNVADVIVNTTTITEQQDSVMVGESPILLVYTSAPNPEQVNLP